MSVCWALVHGFIVDAPASTVFKYVYRLTEKGRAAIAG